MMRPGVLLLAALASCSARPREQADGPPRSDRMQIDGSAPERLTFDILPGRAFAYEYDQLETQVAADATPVVSFTDADVESVGAEAEPAGRIELVLTADASRRLAKPLARVGEQAFVVSSGGKRLFVGIVYLDIGAAALNVPVMHLVPDRGDGRTVVRLGAIQGAWYGAPASDEQRRRIDRPELRAPFEARGVLGSLAAR